ncbi:MAG: DNA polymerase [Spirochaetota bacterium]
MKDFNLSGKEIWFVDFEFFNSEGELPIPICLVAQELLSGQIIRIWKEEFSNFKLPPYPINSNAIFVAYYASAEFGCHLSLGWQLPHYVIDLCIEFKNLTNGLELPFNPDKKKKGRRGLIDALLYYGLDSITYQEKEGMINLILNEKWSEKDKEYIWSYCESDVKALSQLWYKIIPQINISYALLRGEYMKCAAIMERYGIPIDHTLYTILKDNWEMIKETLISKIDKEYNVYENGKTFKTAKFEAWLKKNNYIWPRHDSGHLKLDDKTFSEMSKIYPNINPLRELRVTLNRMRLNDLSIGSDYRNRFILSAFGSITGRNQPRNNKNIFGPSVWLRVLIKPSQGYAIVYIDWSQQEFGIAAALSKDQNMMNSYLSGDPYLQFAKLAGVVPENATKETHPRERDLFKQCALGVLYGMGKKSLSIRIGGDEREAEKLIALHHKTFPKFWTWIENVFDYAQLYGYLKTVFGWTLHITTKTKETTIKNFLMQSNGAEMMRLACCYAIQNGVKICTPIHDALLIEAPVETIEESIRATKQAMAKASKVVLDGFELTSDVKRIDSPARYSDPRGEKMWNTVNDIINEFGLAENRLSMNKLSI